MTESDSDFVARMERTWDNCRKSLPFSDSEFTRLIALAKDGETFRMVVEHRLRIQEPDDTDTRGPVWDVYTATNVVANADLATAVQQVTEKIKEGT
jgi:hypothetical protein